MTDDDKTLVERLRWSDGWFFENPWDHVVYASDDPLEAADRIVAQAAEIERLRVAVKDIQIEAEREKGNWTHLKQVIARKASAALAGKAEQ